MEILLGIWAAVAVLFFSLQFLLGQSRNLRRLLRGLGFGAILAGISAYILINPLWQQGVIWGFSALAYFIVSWLFTGQTYQTNENILGMDRFIGKEAVVIVSITPDTSRGRVRVGHDEWLADSENGQPILSGSRVQVISIERGRLRVRLAPGMN